MPQAAQYPHTEKNFQNKLSKSKTPIKRRAWSPKRRANQAKKARKTKPWRRATGPLTSAGKAITSRNAFKATPTDLARRALSALLSRQARYVRTALAAHKAGIRLPSLHQEGLAITIQLLRAVNAVNLSP